MSFIVISARREYNVLDSDEKHDVDFERERETVTHGQDEAGDGELG